MPINPISFSDAIINAKSNIEYQKSSSWFGKKVFLGYSDSEGWKVHELGLFNRILRKLNLAYRETHFQPINKKLEDLTKDDILPVLNDDVLKAMPRINKRLQEIFNQKIKGLSAQFQSKMTGETEFSKRNFKVQADTPTKPMQNIPIGKANALAKYKQNPLQCGKIQKAMIFNDIKYIELPYSKGNVSSVVGLMQYFSGSEEINLHDPLCQRVIIDVLKECNKETSEQLCQWLAKQNSFNRDLLKECFDIFTHKQAHQLPFSPFAVQVLISDYKNRNWNQTQAIADQHPLPSNHPSIVSAMEILINRLPNDDKIISLTEWMINQPDYDLKTFATWINIFQHKEQENAAALNIYYPLLNKMLFHFTQKWGEHSLAKLDSNTANYVNAKLNPSAQPLKPEIKVQVEKPIKEKPPFIPKGQTEKGEPKTGSVPHVPPALTMGKTNALKQYRVDPDNCTKSQKGMIFNDITLIKPKYKRDLNSVVGLMQDISGLDEVDLSNPLCARVIIDVLKECNKETSEQLNEWLVNQPTFNPSLLKECLNASIYRQQQQLAISPLAIQILMTTYVDKEWNQQIDAQGNRILPSNGQSIVTAMAILIKNLPSDDNISFLTEWMLNQPEYDLNSFSTWIKIFQQKEQEIDAINLYYPLYNKMVAHFKQKWGPKRVAELDAAIAQYLNLKEMIKGNEATPAA